MSNLNIDATNPPSPKVVVAGLVSLLIPGLLAVLMYLESEEGRALYATLPILLVVGIKSLITSLLTLVASYRTVDPRRVVDLATSPKVIAVTVAALLLTAAVEVVNFLAGDEGRALYSDWNPILVVALSAIIPAVGTFLAGYVVVDPARLTPKNTHPQAIEPPPTPPANSEGGTPTL